MKKIELLSPAGDMEQLNMSILYGADAVYLAGTSFGMRSFAGNFSRSELPKAVALAHSQGVKVHVTVNTMPRNEEVVHLPEYLELLDSAGVDALILADLGAFTLAGKYAPHCQRHISTQQSIANYACAQSWYDLGAQRVVLARELSLPEIAEIRARVSKELELETFGHGAMCVSYSGRCLLSNYMTGRDSNRGACAQPCRYQYALMEEKRPGEYFPVFEDEKGTYIMNSRDMCMIDHLDDLQSAGVDCIKLEGRAKSPYYAAIVTGAYRHCIDAVSQGLPLDPVWRDEVEHISHRIYSTGFYYGQPGQYTENSRYIRQWQIVALVESCDETGLAKCSLRNKFRKGDLLECVGPNTRPFALTAGDMSTPEGETLEEPRTPQMEFFMRLPQKVPAMSILRRSVDLSAKYAEAGAGRAGFSYGISIPEAGPVFDEILHAGVDRGHHNHGADNAAYESIDREDQPKDQAHHGAGGLYLAAPGGGNHMALGGCHQTQTGNGKLPGQNDHQRPGGEPAPFGKHRHHGNGQQLIRQRIQKFSEVRNLVAAAGNLSVQIVAETAKDENSQADPHPYTPEALAEVQGNHH